MLRCSASCSSTGSSTGTGSSRRSRSSSGSCSLIALPLRPRSRNAATTTGARLPSSRTSARVDARSPFHSGRSRARVSPALRRILGLLAAVVGVAALLVGRRELATPSRRPRSRTRGLGEVAIFYYPWYGTRGAGTARGSTGSRTATAPGADRVGLVPGPRRRTRHPTRASSARRCARSRRREWRPSSSPGGAPARPRRRGCRRCRAARASRACGSRSTSSRSQGGRPRRSRRRSAASRASGITDFYIYDSTTTPDAEWRALNERLSGVRLFANTSLPGKALAGGFAGLYTYDVYVYDGTSFPRMCASAHGGSGSSALRRSGPGYDAVRATGDPRVRGRARRRHVRPDVAGRGPRRRPTSSRSRATTSGTRGRRSSRRRHVGPPYASYDGAYGSRAGGGARVPRSHDEWASATASGTGRTLRSVR